MQQRPTEHQVPDHGGRWIEQLRVDHQPVGPRWLHASVAPLVPQLHALFDGQTGAEVWAEQVAADKLPFATLLVDSAGDIFAYQPERQDGCVVRQWPCGEVVTRFPFVPMAIEPRASLRVTRTLSPEQKGRGFYLYRLDKAQPFLNLSIDAEPTAAVPIVNSDGTAMIWGQDDGTVTVCDLTTVQKRLARLSQQP